MAGRRGFLKTVALAAGGAAQARALPGPAPAAAKPQGGLKRSPAAGVALQYPRTFTGRRLAMLAFPLGGVGAGSISLGGRGQLRDWEIFNRSEKGKSPQYAFASLWVGGGNRPPRTRVLEARFVPPYEGSRGLGHVSVPGLPRLESCTFTGEYPVAKIAFQDAAIPVKLSLEAFTPFIPLAPDDSGLPVAVLRYRVANPGSRAVKASVCFSLENPLAGPGHANKYRKGTAVEGLFLENPFRSPADPLAGSFALCVVEAGNGKVTYLTGWRAGIRGTGARRFWDDFSDDGELGPDPAVKDAVCSLCLQREIAPGAQADYTFLLAWHFPNRTPAWCGWSAPPGEENTIIGNYYCQRFRDAWHAAEYAAANLPSLEKRMGQFLSAMRQTTLPAPVKEAAMANLSTLATNTCFRTADGKFRGFEGCNDDRGCCYGNCTHVWNYESATHYLFPSLARSMREAAFDLADRLNGLLPIRMELPEGKQTGGTAAADGTMGQIIKAYLDWRLWGDRAWLRQIWPKVKKSLEFAWIPGGWDADRDGVMEGVQHNTYDVEFFGPNPLSGILYLGALRAAEEMARAVGDHSPAEDYRRLFTSGSRWIDNNLFNGQYYVQKIQGMPRARIAPGLLIGDRGTSPDPEHPEYQLGEGCLVDQLLGQCLADAAGLGALLDEQNITAALGSIHKYNYRRALYDHESTERIYALNDEPALLMCHYPQGKRPEIPFKFFSETWTGCTYAAAALMIYRGMVAEGLKLIAEVRSRYDGERRNPWDEAECGHHYARAMASWAPMLAMSGFGYSAVSKELTFLPKLRSNPFRSFWCTPAGWGLFSQSISKPRGRTEVGVLEGEVALGRLRLAAEAVPAAGIVRVFLAGNAVRSSVTRSGETVVLAFEHEIRVHALEKLEIAADLTATSSPG